MFKYKYLCAVFILFFTANTNVIAQTSPLDKKLVHVQELIQQDKIDKAEKYLIDVLEDHPEYTEGWEMMLQINLKQYESSKITDQIFNGKMKITSKDANGKEIKEEDDTLAQSLMKLMQDISPSKRAFSKFLYNARLATAYSKEGLNASIYLRMFLVDVEVDSAVNKKALKYFNEGEKEFGEKNYAKAATLYNRALEFQPNFYKAEMYLGDCFYALKNYPDAIASFKQATVKFPDLLEPSKYLTDAYAKEGLYDKAIDEAIRSITIYPDNSMYVKLEDAAYLAHKKLIIHWTPRGVLPNKMNNPSENKLLTIYAAEVPVKAKGPWVYYQAAKQKVASYCNEHGIINQPNKVTAANYLEVYSWQEMLKNSTDTSLNEARRMQKLGYLDCYVMTTCFHHDFYEQYKDFVAHNADRIKQYYRAQMKDQ